MKNAAEEDKDNQDNTDDNRESISLVQDEVLLVAHFSFSMYFNLSVQQIFKFSNDMSRLPKILNN